MKKKCKTEEYIVEISSVETSWNKEQIEFMLWNDLREEMHNYNIEQFSDYDWDNVVTSMLSTLDNLGQRYNEFQEEMKADAYKREFEDRNYYDNY